MKIINKLIITSTLVSMVVLASMAITANAEVETRIFSDEGKDVIRFLDAYQPDIYNFINGDAIDDDSSTTLKVCQLAGFQRVQSVYSRNYATPYNNTISYWNGSSFAKDSAGNRGNTYIDTLVCADKVANEGNNLGCNDGIDNDFDGNIDFPADSGCSSGDDPDERETSVIASCPAGMTPVSVRQVSLDAKSSLTAGLTARNGFHVAGGTYLLKIINGAISYWNTDSIDTTLSGGGPNRAWLSQANVVYKKNGSFVETQVPPVNWVFFPTQSSADIDGRGRTTLVTIDDTTSSNQNLFIFIKDVYINDNRGSLQLEVIRCFNSNVNIACSSNSQCGTNGFVGSPFCQGGDVYQNYKTYTCNNPGTVNSACSDSSSPQLKQNCAVNQTCSNGVCSNINIACSSNSQCGTDGFTGGPFCMGNSVYKNYTTHTCNNPGTANSSCSQSTAPQLQNTCGYNQTCSNGSCSQQNNLSVSISSYPNSPQINQSVIFSSSVTGGTGNYIYSWTGACAGYSTNCITSFSQSGTYTAYLSVSSGNQTQNASHAITVGQNCTANATQRCIGNSIYWYDSCGNQQGLIQTCNYNQTCSNGYCSNTQQNYITVQTNPATNTYNNQATLNGYVSGINTNNTNYVWFQWGTTTSYGFETNHQTLNYAGFFNQNIAGLSPLVVYHFRAVGQNYNGQIVYGRDLTFQLGQVLGATDISTGFTNNLLVDSFFLPLIIALALIWLFKSRVLNFTHWTDSGKIKHKDYVASKELKLKIAKIKEKEKLK